MGKEVFQVFERRYEILQIGGIGNQVLQVGGVGRISTIVKVRWLGTCDGRTGEMCAFYSGQVLLVHSPHLELGSQKNCVCRSRSFFTLNHNSPSKDNPLPLPVQSIYAPFSSIKLP
jgi:hypothetical protein